MKKYKNHLLMFAFLLITLINYVITIQTIIMYDIINGISYLFFIILLVVVITYISYDKNNKKAIIAISLKVLFIMIFSIFLSYFSYSIFTNIYRLTHIIIFISLYYLFSTAPLIIWIYIITFSKNKKTMEKEEAKQLKRSLFKSSVFSLIFCFLLYSVFSVLIYFFEKPFILDLNNGIYGFLDSIKIKTLEENLKPFFSIIYIIANHFIFYSTLKLYQKTDEEKIALDETENISK